MHADPFSENILLSCVSFYMYLKFHNPMKIGCRLIAGPDLFVICQCKSHLRNKNVLKIPRFNL